MIERSCLICGATFIEEDNQDLDRINNHLKKCTEDEPYNNDNDADYYE